MIGNASAFRINSDQGLSYFNRSSNQSQFNVSPNGVLDAKQIGTDKNPVENIYLETTITDELSGTVQVLWDEGDDLGQVFNDAVAKHGRENVRYEIEPGNGVQPTVSTPMDMTDFRHSKVDMSGVVPHLATGGQVGIDLTDAWDFRLEFSQITADQTASPSTGILVGNVNSSPGRYGQGPEVRKVIGGKIAGYFDYAPIMVHGRERTVIEASPLNAASQGYAAIVDPQNTIYINGSFVSETSPYKGELQSSSSASKTWFRNTSFFSRINAGDGCLYVGSKIPNSSFRDIEMRSVGEPHVVFNTNAGGWTGNTLDNIRARINATDTAAPFIKAVSSGSNGSLRGLTFKDIDTEQLEGTGTPAPFIDPNGVIDKYVNITFIGSVESNGRISPPNTAVKNCTFNGIGVGDKAIFDGSSTVRDASIGECSIGSDAELIGVAGARVDSSTDSNTVRVKGGFKGFVVNSDNIRDAVRTTGSGARIVDVKIENSTGGGFIILHDNTFMRDCRVPSGAVGGEPLLIDGADFRGLGLQITGDVTFRDNAHNGYLTGVIDGDVTFATGAENNDLSNTLITGTVTDNGTGNSY